MARREKIGRGAGVVGLALAVVAYYPSAAPFTPALLLCVPACVAAAVAVWCGSWRMAALTVYFCAATFVISPILFDVGASTLWLIVLPVVGARLAAWSYRGHRTVSSLTGERS
jgi:hypothetical protein